MSISQAGNHAERKYMKTQRKKEIAWLERKDKIERLRRLINTESLKYHKKQPLK